MRISELSRQSGVPVATIKFYLREGLLPPGTPTARNQADYSDLHLARLRFTRTLTGIGQLSLSSVREVLAAVDQKGLPILGLCHLVNGVLFAEQPSTPGNGGVASARVRVDEFIGGLGWAVEADAPGRDVLAQVLAALHRLDWECDVDIFAPYAQAVDQLATQEWDTTPPGSAERVVARMVLFEIALVALRRMAQENSLRVRSTDLASGK
jgi:DNA-binding transcriptional MerR regulator